MEALRRAESNPPGGGRTKTAGGGRAGNSATLAADSGGNRGGRSHEFTEMDGQVHAHHGGRVEPTRTSGECDDGVSLFVGDGVLVARRCQKPGGEAASRSRQAIPLHQPAREIVPAEWGSGDLGRHQEKRADWSLSQSGSELATTRTSATGVDARLSQPSPRQGRSLRDL